MTASLKTKIMGGYLALVVFIFAVGAWAVYNFARLDNIVATATRENYRSIQAAENMIGALERQDSAELLLLLGETQRAKEIFHDGKAEFTSWFTLAESNITVPGEEQVIQKIREHYQTYLTYFSQLVNQQQAGKNQAARQLYLEEIEPQFKLLRTGLTNLAQLNNETLLRRNIKITEEARGAIWSTIIVAAAAILLGFLLGWKISETIVSPTLHLTEKIRQVGTGNWQGDIPIESTDEIGQLAKEFNQMTARLRTYEETTLGKLMAERRKSETITRVISDGVMVLDEQFRLLLVNTSAEAIFNILEREVLGRHFLQAINRRDIFARLEEAIKRAATTVGLLAPNEQEQSHQSRPTFAVKVDLRTRYYQLEIIPLEGPAGKIAGLVAVFNDITFFKELDNLKTDFISKVSHELRTPLTSMTMGIGLLKESVLIPAKSKESEILEAVDEETGRLDRLVNQLLDLSRLESGGTVMEFQPVDAEKLFQNMVETFLLQAEQQKVRMQFFIEPKLAPVWADYDKIASALTNLIDNALRYTSSGDEITLDAKAWNGMALFSVTDTGPGIPLKDQAHIFDKFFQVKGRPGGGAGLGLAICTEIVEAHGGSIWVSCEEGKHTTFLFTLPFAMAEREKPHSTDDDITAD